MKKRISKTEYVKAIRRTETALRRELKKSDAARDDALTAELIESLDYYRGELEAAKRESGAPSFLAGLKRAAVVMLAFIVSFAAFATIAQAAGFRVWTAIIKRDAGYLRVDYVPAATADPTSVPSAAPTERETAWEDGEYSFFFADELEARMKEDGFAPLPTEWGNMEFVEGSVRRTANEYYAVSTLWGGGGCIKLRMIAKADPEQVTVWGLKEDAPVHTVKVGGTEAFYQVDEEDGTVFATWQKGNRVYCISMFECRLDPEELIVHMLSARSGAYGY